MSCRYTDRDWTVVKCLMRYCYNKPNDEIVRSLFPTAADYYIEEKIEVLRGGLIHFFGALDEERQKMMIETAIHHYGEECGL